ncbi:MAG: glycosyltransferase [Thermomicrobium sp.]|nr:glycosyltransferase [Thermomicrobium sp.]MDW7982632.1 glycosyltransferase [Thermomicrobium sp.]
MRRRSVRPDVSIVIPARNEAATIAGALGSALRQACPLERIEVVVDNGSCDGTAAVVYRFARAPGAADPGRPRAPARGESSAQPGGSRGARTGLPVPRR